MKKNKFLLVLFSFFFALNSISAYNSEDLKVQIGIDELINCCGEDFIEDIGIVLYDLQGNIIGEKNISAYDLENETSIIIDGINTSSDYIIVVVKTKSGTKVIKKIRVKK
jgi:hypothetical protein